MAVGLAEAVIDALARVRPVAAAEAATIARLAAPDDAVAEVQLEPAAGTLAPVIGFAAAGTRSVLAGATEPASAARDRWLDDVAADASDWGAKLGPARQLYARGRFAPPASAAALVAAAGASHLAMRGLDLDASSAPVRYVGYVAVLGATPAIAFARARGIPGAARALEQLAPRHDWLHLSWDLATPTGAFKADAGPHQLHQLLTLVATLGLPLDAAALEAQLAALGLGDPSHVGLRFPATPAAAPALTLYFRITAS